MQAQQVRNMTRQGIRSMAKTLSHAQEAEIQGEQLRDRSSQQCDCRSFYQINAQFNRVAFIDDFL